jgi:hypothetical protein
MMITGQFGRGSQSSRLDVPEIRLLPARRSIVPAGRGFRDRTVMPDEAGEKPGAGLRNCAERGSG